MSAYGDRVPGWISKPEMEFVAEQMHAFGVTGKILEIGSACGRLFDYLYEQLPYWKYTAVDPWENQTDACRLYIDWSGPYEEHNLGEVITRQMFLENCPFAKAHQYFFEEWKTAEKFDVINIGCGSSTIDFYVIYEKAKQLLQSNGAIIATNVNHKKYNYDFKSVITKNNLRIEETRWCGNRCSCLVKE